MAQSTSSSLCDLGSCDYLIVGAGAMGLAFLDTLLAQQPQSQIVLVDRRAAPGGHWIDAYDYVHLHQPSLVYGVGSKLLEGSWMKLLLQGILPWNHRASKAEIVEYYRTLVDSWIAQGRVRYFPNSNYDFGQLIKEKNHTFTSKEATYKVKVEEKLVDGVQGEVKIPAFYPPEFPVAAGLKLWTPNELFLNNKESAVAKSWFSATLSWFSKLLFGTLLKPKTPSKKYVVIGCGKTGMDTVVFLQTKLHVSPQDIIWVISGDVWILNRAKASPELYAQGFLRCDGDHEKAMDYLESENMAFRLDPLVRPTAQFRFPTISSEELTLLRKVDNKVRKGRVTSISIVDQSPCLKFKGTNDDLVLGGEADSYVFIHCSTPGPFNDNHVDKIFTSDTKLTLYFLFAPPVPLSGSTIAMVESARRSKTLDLDFARELVGNDFDENELLQRLFHGYYPGGDKLHHLLPIQNLAMFLGIFNTDVQLGAKWMRSNNRLSLFNWTSKMMSFENLNTMVEKKKVLGFSNDENRMYELLAEKLEPLKGL